MKNLKILWLLSFLFLFPAIASGAILFQEGFEDANFASRGWYDSTNLQLSTTEHVSGSTASVEYRFLQGATTPVGSGAAIRRLFTTTNEVYVSYWVKYSSNWQGSNRPYHPHEFLIMTNENSSYWGPSSSHLTAYIEQNEGIPMLLIQDSQNIDTTNIGVDLTAITENRAVAGCNGASASEGYSLLDCYNVGEWRNAKEWKLTSVYFQDTPGQYYKNDWHHIEAYFKLNSISGGIGLSDGIVQYWYDGTLLIDHTNVILRTGQYPNMMFNQFLIAPWIGDGSPIEQTMWVDNLIVATDRASVGGNNASPTVTLSANTTIGNAPLSVNFTAAAADSDGTITQYEWDLDGNGTYEAANTNSTRSYTYNSTSAYNARVRVTDNGGATAINAVTITVSTTTGGGSTPPPSSNSGGSSDSGGGSGGGCGFMKGKMAKEKGGGLSMIMLFLFLLTFFKLKKKQNILGGLFIMITTKKSLFLLSFSIAILIFFEPAISEAATYYVSPTGSAQWAACTNINTPCSWQTAMANAVADDIVYFRGGTYNVGVIGSQRDYANMRPSNSGTAGNPITFIAYPGEVPNITGTVNSSSTAAYFGCSYNNYIIWDGFAATLQIYSGSYETQTWGAWGSTYCTIKNSNFTGTNVGSRVYNTSFVRIEGANYTLVENNYFHDLTGTTGAVNTSGIWLFDGDYTTIRNNTFYNTRGAVYGKTFVSSADIYNNFVYNPTLNDVQGIYINRNGGGTTLGFNIYQNIMVGCNIDLVGVGGIVNNSKIYNNTIYNTNGNEGINISSGVTNVEIFNNIIYGPSPLLRYYTASTYSYANNNSFYRSSSFVWNLNWTTNYTSIASWTAATGFDANSITSNPLFVNTGGASAADYKLQASSPARTSGRGGSYATVMGAYITGNETIGYTSDPTLQFSSATYEVSEGIATATITVTRIGSSAGAVSVNYATSNGTATAGSDYTATSGTLNWADGDGASKTFTIPIANDISIESDETINLTLSNPSTGAIIGSVSTAILTILDNDGPPILRFENSSYSISEGGGTATIRVLRTGSSAGAVSVNYATSNGSATAGSDYTATSGTLSWASGDTAARQFTVSITNDTTVESSETINLTLSNPTNGAQLGGTNPVVLTITNDDSNPNPSPNPNLDSNITTNSSAVDAEVQGGGCGFVNNDNGKGPRAKGEGLTLMIMLIMTLAGIAIARRFSNRFSYNL